MLIFDFSNKFICSADQCFNKSFWLNYLSPFVVSCCSTYQHMEHVLNWAVTVSLFYPPGLLIWIFMSTNDLSKYLPLHCLPACYILLQHASSLYADTLTELLLLCFISVKTTHHSFTIGHGLGKYWSEKVQKKENEKASTIWRRMKWIILKRKYMLAHFRCKLQAKIIEEA